MHQCKPKIALGCRSSEKPQQFSSCVNGISKTWVAFSSQLITKLVIKRNTIYGLIKDVLMVHAPMLLFVCDKKNVVVCWSYTHNAGDNDMPARAILTYSLPFLFLSCCRHTIIQNTSVCVAGTS